MEPKLPYLDAIVAMTLMATHTSTINVGVGVFELPLHHPVMLAKQLVGIDHLSQGRVLAGVGVGYLRSGVCRLRDPAVGAGQSRRRVHRRDANVVDDVVT
jgi:alkanesulfonate monooxygenase SsuD/methylene tetrahydromethanopterin reductase-like flavin-dependent oxidoreductase (luciferase family)